MLCFRQWLEDCGPVAGNYSNMDKTDMGDPLAYVKSKRQEGQRKKQKQEGDPEPDKLFGFGRKKMKK